MNKFKDLSEISNRNTLLEISQSMIKAFPHTYEEFYTGNTLKCFKPGDIVKCTFMKGPLRVSGSSNDKLVIVYPIEDTRDIAFIYPEFLIKIEANEKAIEVLYGDKSRRLLPYRD